MADPELSADLAGASARPATAPSEHTSAVVVDLDADEMFAWLAEPVTLTCYVPGVVRVARTGLEGVVLHLADGTSVAAWLRVYRGSRQLAWGTDDGAYRGELHVSRRTADGGCSVTVSVRIDRLAHEAARAATEAVLAAAADAARTDRTTRKGGRW